MTLDELNGAPRAVAAKSLLACCASTRWVGAVLSQRPFTSLEALLAASEAAWRATGPNDWIEAIAAHPRIGARDPTDTDAGSRAWSASEQSGVDIANAATRSALADANREYEARFGHIYLVCASGKSAAELLGDLRARMRNTPEQELAVAGEELRKIARLRLEKLL
ncbi:MAG: 2-oxo-4-hydroxy-4-carboxy-5-ureidoimidazoline decarboxylase, partial [Gemmatimonadaceae bacterium]